MIYTAIAFFALAAILGMVLLSFVLKGKETPKGIVFTHGPLAAIGLILLIIYTINNPGPIESIVLFTIAALGGVVLVVRDLSKKPVPKWLAVVHGLIAVSGFIFLLVFAFGKM
jgi:peptidoglycan/LPS O-acetylase OafA/YrhL